MIKSVSMLTCHEKFAFQFISLISFHCFCLQKRKKSHIFPLINLLWMSDCRIIENCIQSSTDGSNLHVALNHVFLLYVTFTPLIMPLADWPLPSFMHAWACVYAWKSFDSLCQGQGFSSSLCQITGCLTDKHSYTANLCQLSSPVSAPHLSRFSATHRYTYLKICSWDSFGRSPAVGWTRR